MYALKSRAQANDKFQSILKQHSLNFANHCWHFAHCIVEWGINKKNLFCSCSGLQGSLRNAVAQFKCNFLSSSEVSGYSNVFNFNEILHLNFFNYTLQFVLNYKSLETWWFNLGAAITITSFAKYIFLITTKSQPNWLKWSRKRKIYNLSLIW